MVQRFATVSVMALLVVIPLSGCTDHEGHFVDRDVFEYAWEYGPGYMPVHPTTGYPVEAENFIARYAGTWTVTADFEVENGTLQVALRKGGTTVWVTNETATHTLDGAEGRWSFEFTTNTDDAYPTGRVSVRVVASVPYSETI